MPSQEWAKNTMAGRMSKSDKLGAVDHSKIDYAPFRRNFYIEVQELQKMSEEDVAKYRKELDDIKVRHTALPTQAVHPHPGPAKAALGQMPTLEVQKLSIRQSLGPLDDCCYGGITVRTPCCRLSPCVCRKIFIF